MSFGKNRTGNLSLGICRWECVSRQLRFVHLGEWKEKWNERWRRSRERNKRRTMLSKGKERKSIWNQKEIDGKLKRSDSVTMAMTSHLVTWTRTPELWRHNDCCNYGNGWGVIDVWTIEHSTLLYTIVRERIPSDRETMTLTHTQAQIGIDTHTHSFHIDRQTDRHTHKSFFVFVVDHFFVIVIYNR